MNNKCTNCETMNDSFLKYCLVCGYKMPLIKRENQIKENVSTTINKGKINIKTVLGFIAGFVAIFFIAKFLFNPSFDKQLVKVADEINKTCPIKTDGASLDSVTVLPNKTIQYNYTLVDVSKEEVNLDTVKKYVFTGILEGIKIVLR